MKLIAQRYDFCTFEEYHTEPSKAEVIAWLREKGVGFTGEAHDGVRGLSIPVEDAGLYILIPLEEEK